MAIAGHVSPKILQHYSRVRLEAKRSALDAISTTKGSTAVTSGDKRRGYVTSYVTNSRMSLPMKRKLLNLWWS
jgi:hypothetical protein